MAKIWMVCSGSGGVGKSAIALSLAVGAAKTGKQVILMDLSGLSRSCDLILGLESIIALDVADAIATGVPLSDALYPVPRYDGLRIACGSLLGETDPQNFASAILVLQSLCDILVLDMPTGSATPGRGLLGEADDRLLIVRPDDASIRSCERLMMGLGPDNARNSVIVNMTRADAARRGLQYTPETISAVLDIPSLGSVPFDEGIPAAAKNGRPAIESDGHSSQRLRSITKQLLSIE